MAQDIYPVWKPATLLAVYIAWSGVTTYAIDDRVSHIETGVTKYYRCILGHTNHVPPNGTYWVLETPASGARFSSYTKLNKDWNEITIETEYEDKAKDTNESADDAPQRWTITYVDKPQAVRKLIMDFWDSQRRSEAFTLIEPRDEPWTTTSGMGNHGNVVADVFFESVEDGGHSETSYKRNNFTVKLVKWP